LYTEHGKRMLRLAFRFVKTGDFVESVRHVYGYMPHFNTIKNLRNHKPLWRRIAHEFNLELGRLGIAKDSFVTRSNNTIDWLLKQLDDPKISIERKLEVSKEIRQWMSMCGGDWAGLSSSISGEVSSKFLWKGDRRYLGPVEDAQIVD